MNRQGPTSADPPAGLLSGLSGLARNLFRLAASRIELAALELGEMRDSLAKLLLLAALGIIAVWFALAYWSALIVVVAWDAWGWKILLLMAAVFSALAAALLLYVRAMLRQGRLSMRATMAELRKDRDALL